MTEPVPVLSFDQVLDRLLALQQPYHAKYLAMYSSWYGGIIVDPALMMVPVDDHLVHRGDGIFEAFKSVAWHVYALDRHLDRLERSARSSALSLPMSRAELVRTILATIRAANAPDCLARLLVSRGPGGFTANPYECPQSQLYVVVVALHLPPPAKYAEGVRIISSRVPMKSNMFSGIKSCNYLPNVFMKKESEDAGVEFSISIDEDGFLGEGPTENVGIITKDRRFLVPRFDRVLRGTTVTRMMELAQSLVETGELIEIGEADITPRQACEAAEIMMFGTSFDVLPVVEYDGHPIGDGHPGPVARKFMEIFREDLHYGSELRTPVLEGKNT